MEIEGSLCLFAQVVLISREAGGDVTRGRRAC